MDDVKTQMETLSSKLYDEIHNSTNDAKTAKSMSDVFKNNLQNLWNTMIEVSSGKYTDNNITNTTIQSPSTTTQSPNTTTQSPNTSELHQICYKNINDVIAKSNEKEKKEAFELRKKYNNKYKYLPMNNKPCSTTCNIDRYLSKIRKTNANLTPQSLLPRIKLIKYDYYDNSQGSSSKDADKI